MCIVETQGLKDSVALMDRESIAQWEAEGYHVIFIDPNCVEARLVHNFAERHNAVVERLYSSGNLALLTKRIEIADLVKSRLGLRGDSGLISIEIRAGVNIENLREFAKAHNSTIVGASPVILRTHNPETEQLARRWFGVKLPAVNYSSACRLINRG